MKIRDMTLCALFAALLCICAWLSLPIADIAFTMQTFGILLTLGILGGKRGTLSILVYLALGAVGLPVFSGFQGGIGSLLGVTGGYLTGFLFTGLAYWLITALAGTGPKARLVAMTLGLLVCYLFGSIWFCALYLQQGSSLRIGAVIAKCVLPYLLPDGLKLAAAWLLSSRLCRLLQGGK